MPLTLGLEVHLHPAVRRCAREAERVLAWAAAGEELTFNGLVLEFLLQCEPSVISTWAVPVCQLTW